MLKKINDSLGRYEDNTGDKLPLNVLAKVSWLGGAALFAVEMVANSGPKDGLLPAAMIIGGAIGDKLTGGFNSSNQLESSEES